jgi:hypothetical protein
MQVTLSDWEREQFGSVRHELSSLRRRLEEVRARSLHTGPLREEREIMRSLAEILARRMSWRNRGHVWTGCVQVIETQPSSTPRPVNEREQIKLLRSDDRMGPYVLINLGLNSWLWTSIATSSRLKKIPNWRRCCVMFQLR